MNPASAFPTPSQANSECSFPVWFHAAGSALGGRPPSLPFFLDEAALSLVLTDPRQAGQKTTNF